jgi:serine/threonine-protein kinase
LGFERNVVLKRTAASVADSGSARARLLREATAYARLVHPAIVRLYDFVDEAGEPTLVLEHVEGVSLRRVLEWGRDLRLPDACAAYIGYRVFLALAQAHAAKDPVTNESAPIVHKAVSPDHVLVPWDGYVKLGGFGSARVPGRPSDTQPGASRGALGYLAPEQVRGEDVSSRTDVYCACLLLRELWLGEPAFPRRDSSEFEILGAMAVPNLQSLASRRQGLPARLVDAMDRGLSANPELRSLTAAEMVAVLRDSVDLELARETLVVALVGLRVEASNEELALEETPAVALTTPDMGTSLFEESTLDLERATDTVPRAAEPHPEAILKPFPPPAPVPRTSSELRQVVTAPMPARTPSVGSIGTMRPVTPRRDPSSEPIELRSPWPSGAAPALPRVTTRPPGLAFASPTVPPPRSEVVGPLATLASRETLRPNETEAHGSRGAGIIAIGAALAIVMGISIGGVLGLRERAKARARAVPSRVDDVASARRDLRVPPPSSAVHAPLAAPRQVASAVPVATAASTAVPPARASASPPTPTPTSSVGRLITAPIEHGHRVFVDGRTIGSGGVPLVVPCGKHEIRVGSEGRLRKIDVPCGEDITVTR